MAALIRAATFLTAPRRREILLLISALVAAVVVGLLAFSQFATSSFRAGPARFTAGMRVDGRPSTTLDVPPFGSVSARTHRAPLALSVRLQEVDLEGLDGLASQGVPDQATIDGWVLQFKDGLARSAETGLLVAALAAGATAVVLRRKWWAVLLAAAIGALVPGLLFASVVRDFDAAAFRNPTYRGSLTYAPALVKFVEERAGGLSAFKSQIVGTARTLADYYARPQSFAAGGELAGTYRVLHVSDIHLDPVGLALQRSLCAEFGVSLVIDTGDIDFFGSKTEAGYVASQLPTNVPTVFVPGNHDSPDIVKALQKVPNVRVLDATRTVIDGFDVLGIGDPMSHSIDFTPNHALSVSLASRVARSLRDRMAAGEPTPTLVAVHDPAMAPSFTGIAPLILEGHTHTAALSRTGRTWLLNAGTTGGMDLTDMRTDRNVGHTAAVLYYTKSLPRRLIAIDQIEVSADGGSSLKRTIIAPALLQALSSAANDTTRTPVGAARQVTGPGRKAAGAGR